MRGSGGRTGCTQLWGAKGFEEGKNGKWEYGQKIVRGNLRKPMVEICPLRMGGMELTELRSRRAQLECGWDIQRSMWDYEYSKWTIGCVLVTHTPVLKLHKPWTNCF